MKRLRLLASACLSACFAACSLQPSIPTAEPAAIPDHWQAPLPHNGSLSALKTWWAQLDDRLLVELIDSAQRVSPTIAAAATRIAQAESTLTDAQASLLPELHGVANATRSSAQPPVIPNNTTLDAGLRASWEIDLFGAHRADRAAGRAHVAGAQVAWHDARVTVAADVANLYYSVRACTALVTILRADTASSAETARLVALAAEAGFESSATAAQARAATATSSQRVTQQQAQCDLDVKALVALSAMSEPTLRARLAQTSTVLIPDRAVALASVPADMLAQRPDVVAAEREQIAASFEVGGADAVRYPRLTLNGAIGRSRFSGGGLKTTLDTWSVGPLTLIVPLFDGGSSDANLHLAKVRYAETSNRYRATVRDAVREVEQALVNLASSDAQRIDADTALQGYRVAYDSVVSRQQAGLASDLDVEAARRVRLAAETTQLTLQQQRMAAWIALYRALGGGWTPSVSTATP
jgi:multidrug efflux system outer membrane protein